jgi:hypothetical protein
MSEGENELVVQALHYDDVLMQEYLDMLSTLDQLNQLVLTPSEKVVKGILWNAKSTGLEKV